MDPTRMQPIPLTGPGVPRHDVSIQSSLRGEEFSGSGPDHKPAP